MPRLSQSLPKYRRKVVRGKVQAVVTLDGKDHYLGPHGTKSSRNEYDRLVGLWQANGRRMPVEHQSVTVTELCAEYWRFAKTYYRKNGKPTDELPGTKVALRVLRRLYGRLPVEEFGPIKLTAVQNAFIDEGHSRRYINQNVGRIKRMFKWGVSRELVPVAVYQALATVSGLRKGKSAARETAPILPVADDVVEKTIRHIRRKVTADMVRLQRLTGCRPGELFEMKPRNIDRSGTLDNRVWIYRPESHKTEHRGKERAILIGPEAQKVLAPYLLRGESDHCFTRRDGKPYQRWHYAQQIERACDRAKVERWAPNRLRHSAATDIRAKYGLEASQTVLGHSNAQVTQIYAERDMIKAAQIMAEVG